MNSATHLPAPSALRSLTRFRSILLGLTAALAAGVSACGDGTLDMLAPESGGAEDWTVVVVGGEAQAGEVASLLPAPLVVEVRTADGLPVAGAPIEWTFEDGAGVEVDGTLGELGEEEGEPKIVSQTDEAGRASVAWRLGPESGGQLGTVQIVSLAAPVAYSGGPGNKSGKRATFHASAKAGKPAWIEIDPDGASVERGGTVQLQAVVFDRYDNPVENADLRWRSEDTDIVTVDDSGRVTGESIGSARVTARAQGAQKSVTLQVTAGGELALRRGGGNDQTGRVGEALTDRVGVRMVDGSGQGVPGVTVRWTVVDGGGSVSSNSSTTGSDGRTSVSWTLGETAGEQRLSVGPDGGPSVSFRATAVPGPPVTLRVSPARSVLGHEDEVNLRASGIDAYGNEIESVEVNWSSDQPAFASVTERGVVTGLSKGVATITARAGDATGQHVATVVGSGESFLRSVSGSDQTGPVGETLSERPTVRVVDASGNGVSGVAVRWSIRSGGGSLSSQSTTTGDDGRTGVAWTLGRTVGNHVIEASAGEMPAVTFEATATAGPLATMQLTPRESVLGRGDVARVRAAGEDRFGNAVSGFDVTFSSSDPEVATVSQEGVISATGPGTATITARSGSVSATHTSNVQGGSQTLRRVRGDGQSAPVGEEVGTRPTVRVVDGWGNGVQGVTIRWTVRSGGGSVSSSTSTTGSNGEASVAWTLGGESNEQSLEASGEGLSSVRFSATSVPAGASSLNRVRGNQQSATVGTTLGTRPTVRAVNASGEGVSGVTVRWTVRSGGGSLSSGSTTTGSNGETSVDWTLGGNAGEQSIQASAGDLSVSFVAQATAGAVDRIEVSPSSSDLEEGESIQLSARAFDRFGNRVSNPGVTWSSDNTGVATVASGGRLTAQREGTTSIYARANGVSGRHGVTVRTPPSPSPGEYNEPDGYTVVVDEHWNNFETNDWWHEIDNTGNVNIQNGRVVWTYTQGMEGGHTPGGTVGKEVLNGPYQYQRDEGVRLSRNFHGHRSGVNKFRYWSDLAPRGYIGFFGADDTRLYLGINKSSWAEGNGKLRWDSPENYANPTREQAEIHRGRDHTIETLVYIGTAGNYDGWVKAWLDGVLILDFRNLGIIREGHRALLTQVHMSPVWGGTGDVVPETQTLSVDRTYVSERRR